MTPPATNNLRSILVFFNEDGECRGGHPQGLVLPSGECDTRSTSLWRVLSDRERQVFEGLRRGLGRKSIARELGVTPGSIAGYSRSICRKLGIHNPVSTCLRDGSPPA